MKSGLAAVVAVVWLIREEPASVFSYGGVVSEGSCQSGHVGHGVEH